MGFEAEHHKVPDAVVKAAGLQSITNLIVQHRFGDGPTIALNAHGDVVPPGDGWTQHPYRAEIVDGKLYGRASAVSKSDFATYTYALRALIASGAKLRGAVELHFTYDEEFGGELGPGLAAQPRAHAARRADRRRLQLPGGGGAQRLPAARGHAARAGQPRRLSRHRRRCAAGGQQAAHCAVRAQRRAAHAAVEGGGHPAPLPQRGPHRRRHQHQRDPGQGGAQARPPHDPGGRRRRRSRPRCAS